MVEENNVSGLFAAYIITVVQHFFKNVTVAYLRAYCFYLVFVHKAVEAEITHYGDDSSVVFQRTHFLHIT